MDKYVTENKKNKTKKKIMELLKKINTNYSV